MIRPRHVQFGPMTFVQAVNRIGVTLFVGVIVTLMHQYLWLDADDRYGCKALLAHGQWLDPSVPHSQQAFHNWQPPGCIMHEYNAEDIVACIGSRNVVLIGDSTIRDTFWAIAGKLNPKAASETEIEALKHQNQNFTEAGVNVRFIWDPFLNSTSLQKELDSYRRDSNTAILLVGGGLWHAKHLGATYLSHFKNSIEKIERSINIGSSNVRNPSSRKAAEKPTSKNLLAITPVQVPLYEKLQPLHQEMISPVRVDSLNSCLKNVSSYSQDFVFWSYAHMILNEKSAYDRSGIHCVESISQIRADIIFNVRCNADLVRSKGYPMDKTCCSQYPKLKWVQVVIMLGSLAILPFGIFQVTQSPLRTFSYYSKMCYPVSILAVTLCYSFYADRTHFFKKAHKEYSSTDFKTMCLAALTLGVLSIQRSSSPVQKSSRSSIKKQMDHSFLSRDQTNEWKGWMQFIILIYHYTGASKILEIYIIIRVLVASYLFMTGFGHTVFFYQKGDYSLRRCASVLIKLNLLSSILPYIMNTDYLFYYFAPLISFWYLVIYFTMMVASSRNKSALLLFSKIAISAIIITSLIRIPSVFEWLFLVLARICNIHWNVAEWHFRLQLDAYIVYFGMLSAVLFIKIGSAIEDEATESKFFGFIRRYWFPIRAAATFLAVITLPVFWHLAQRSSNKYDYNLWEPYVSAFPILAYIILRNCNRYARNFHSALFAWLGLHSLETFTLQFHIWLAADTKGLLALGIFSRNGDYVGGRWPDFLVITTIFLWISWHVAAATTSITSWIVGPGAGESVVGREGIATIDLPATSSYVNLYGQADRSLGETGWRGQTRKACRVFKEHLRVRLAIILIVMWLLNMTY